MKFETKKMENGYVLVKYPKSEGILGIGGKDQSKKFIYSNIDEMMGMIKKLVVGGENEA